MSSPSDDRTEDAGTEERMRFWLEYQGQTLDLAVGVVLVGRSSGCHIVLDDGLVSRRHAQFLVNAKAALVEDFGSVNGVYVNGERVAGQRTLRDGDRVLVGKQEFLLRSALQAARSITVPERFGAETLHGATMPRARPEPEKDRDELTRRADALELLCGVADKVLVLGRGDEAEKLLEAALTNLLTQAQQGASLAPASLARAASYAVRIADATGRPRWVDYCFALYSPQSRPLPVDVVDQLHLVVRKVNGVGLALFRGYLERLRGAAAGLSPSDRFALQRLEGLERLILR